MNLRKKIIATAVGAVMGILIVHPLSMVFQSFVHPEPVLALSELSNAFNVHHFPMAVFFGILGAVSGYAAISYSLKLAAEREQVRLLRKFLPICAYCKKIRIGDSHDADCRWLDIDHYIASRTDVTFSHGMCPECFENVMEENALLN